MTDFAADTAMVRSNLPNLPGSAEKLQYFPFLSRRIVELEVEIMSTVTEELKEVKKRLEKQTAHFKELQKDRTHTEYILLTMSRL